MAAPSQTTIQNLNGRFVLNKELSDDTDAVLALQGISWLTRKAIKYATVTLNVIESVEPNTDDEGKAPVTKFNVKQVTTGGIETTVNDVTDWRFRSRDDRVFGSLQARTRLIRGSKGTDGKVRPDVDVQTEHKDDKIAKFLRGDILADGTAGEGFLVDNIDEGKDGVAYGEGEGLFLHSWVINETSQWTAEQVWGFEIIQGKRHYTRRAVVAKKGGKFLLSRIVYDYAPAE